MTITERLKTWRDQTARREGVEPYFVLHYDTLEIIARERPETLEALATIKGIGPKKIEKYGLALIALVRGQATAKPIARETETSRTAITVSEYLGRINESLAAQTARLRGEVGRVDQRDHGVYFEFRDPEGVAVISCLIFSQRYELMGVELREGLALTVEGCPSIYPRTGRLTFRAETIELVGEGRLQQAYLQLKRQLEAEGLLASERKRPLPEYVQQIGLVTSAHGEAVHDFTANLEPAGLAVRLYDCRVEGARAISDVVAAIHWFDQHRAADVVVITRGGGSWESLQAFNSAAVCRAIAASRIPVLVGIGHERDVPLSALVADVSVSTPTAAAKCIGQSWRDAKNFVAETQRQLTTGLADALHASRITLRHTADSLTTAFETGIAAQRQHLLIVHERTRRSLGNLWLIVPRLRERVRAAVRVNRNAVSQQHARLGQFAHTLRYRLNHEIAQTKRRLEARATYITAANPRRLLAQGYSLVRKDKTIIRSPAQLKIGDLLSLQFDTGGATSVVQQLTPSEPYDPN